MPDDDRTRRRLGDETKARIADLASGWSVDAPKQEPAPEIPVPAAEATPPARKKPRTVPPPPPGSQARKALEEAIVDSKSPAPEEPRTKPPTTPPPLPRARQTSPPPIPLAKTRSEPPGPVEPPKERTPLAVDAAPRLVAPQPPPIHAEVPATRNTPSGSPVVPAKLAVPVGEFDSGVQTIDDDKRRSAPVQATIKRDAAEALLQIPGAPATVVKETPVEVLLGETAETLRGDPTSIDPSTSPFDRGDATEIQGPSTALPQPGSGTLRAGAALRRKRGLAGDVRYVFTALSGVRRSRRELAELEHRQGIRQISRRRHLVTLGRTAVTADAFDHPALGRAREQLQAIEDERSKHAGAVAASDAELDRVRRDRDAKAKQHATDHAGLDGELAELAKKLEPLEKEASTIKRRATELKETLARISKKQADTEALLVSVKAEKMDKAAIQAELATLKADRQSVQRDEPVIAAELDALNPRIAAIEAARTEATKKKTEIDKAEAEDQRRTTELLEAIGAKRKVVERAAGEAEAARDVALFELGERLYVDRPTILGAQLSPIDQIDLELGESDRRVMELREILSNIDRAKFARGAAAIVLALAAAGTIVGWLLYMLL